MLGKDYEIFLDLFIQKLAIRIEKLFDDFVDQLNILAILRLYQNDEELILHERK